MKSKYDASLNTLAIMLSQHLKRWRLLDLAIEKLPDDRKREILTKTLDYFEDEVSQAQTLNGEDRKVVAGVAAGENRLRSKSRLG